MLKLKHRILFLSLLTTAGCQLIACERKKDSSTTLADFSVDPPAMPNFPTLNNPDGSVIPLDYAKPITCAADLELYTFSLQPLNRDYKTLDLSQLELRVQGRGIFGPNTGEVLKPSSQNNVRLDICINQDGSTAELMRIVTSFKSKGFRDQFVSRAVFVKDKGIDVRAKAVVGVGITAQALPEKSFKVKNLSAALGGDLSDFSLNVAPGEEQINFQMQGRTIDSESALGAWYFIPEKSDFPVDSQAIAGVLENADAFAADSACEAGWLAYDEIFDVGSAKLRFKSCVFKTTSQGNTRFAKRLSLHVKDENPALKGAKIDLHLEGAKLSEVLKEVTTHHNMNDRIELNLPAAKYIVNYENGSDLPAPKGTGF